MTCEHHIFGDQTVTFEVDSEAMVEQITSNVCDLCRMTAWEYDQLTNPGAMYRARDMQCYYTHPARREMSEATREGDMQWTIVPRLKLRPILDPNATSTVQLYEFGKEEK